MSLERNTYVLRESLAASGPLGHQGPSVLQPILPAVSTDLYHTPTGLTGSFSDIATTATTTPVRASLFQQRLQPMIMQQPVPVRRSHGQNGYTSLSQHYLQRPQQQQLLPKLSLSDVPSSSSLLPPSPSSASLSSSVPSTSAPLSGAYLSSSSSFGTDGKFYDVNLISGHTPGYAPCSLPTCSSLSGYSGANHNNNNNNSYGGGASFSYGNGYSYPASYNYNSGNSREGCYCNSNTSEMKEGIGCTDNDKFSTGNIVGVPNLGNYTPDTGRSQSVNSYFTGAVNTANSASNYCHGNHTTAGNAKISIPDIIQPPLHPSGVLGGSVRIDNIPNNDHNILITDINSQRMNSSSSHYSPSSTFYLPSTSVPSLPSSTSTSTSFSSLMPNQTKLAAQLPTGHNSSLNRPHSALNTQLSPSSSSSKCHKIHKCRLCEKSFIRKSWLERHLLSHSVKRNFLCPWCLSKHKRKDNLLQHIKLKHNNSLLEELQLHRINFNWDVLLEKRRQLGPKYAVRDMNNVKDLLDDGILNKVDVKRVLDQIVARGRSV